MEAVANGWIIREIQNKDETQLQKMKDHSGYRGTKTIKLFEVAVTVLGQPPLSVSMKKQITISYTSTLVVCPKTTDLAYRNKITI